MAITTQIVPTVVLRRKQVEQRIGLSRTAIYARLNPKDKAHDASFPRPISLGSKAIGWIEADVEAWIQSKRKAS